MTTHHAPLGGDADDFERELLLSARDDAPSPAARRRTVAALGIASAAGAAATAGGVAQVSKGAAAGSSSLIVALKWLALGFGAGAVTMIGASALFSEPEPEPVDVAAPVVAPTKADRARSPMTVEESTDRGEREVVDEPHAELPPAPAVPPSLDEEVRSIERARAALAAGDGGRALSLLDQHARRFPAGTLGLEAEVVRIEALLASGRKGEAVSRAGRFLERHPRTPHTERVRRMVESAEGER